MKPHRTGAGPSPGGQVAVATPKTKDKAMATFLNCPPEVMSVFVNLKDTHPNIVYKENWPFTVLAHALKRSVHRAELKPDKSVSTEHACSSALNVCL